MKVKEKAKQFVNDHKNLLIGVGVGLGSCGLMLTGYYFGRNKGLVEGGAKVLDATGTALFKTLNEAGTYLKDEEVDNIAQDFTSNFKTTKLNEKYAVTLDCDVKNEKINGTVGYLIKD